ncbi:MAG: SCP2 sterol-binding domain-containing protein [Deltaproteobacteria bacterium]
MLLPLCWGSITNRGRQCQAQLSVHQGDAWLRIAEDRCTFHEGAHEKPAVLIKAPAEVWLAISQGALNGQSAFMSGKYRVEGNVGLLLKLKTLFPV